MVRQSDQEGALLLSDVSRPGNRRIRAPNQPAQETRIAVSILNRMLDRPESVRAA
jgi:hypothetical protein